MIDSKAKRYVIYKRVFDIAVSLLGLLISFPLLIIIAIAIKLDSKGPILFAQERLGKGGRPFKLYKFRSMVHGAEKLKERLRHLSEATGPVFKIRRDPRITKIGKLLRRTSMDELPQLFNVLKGEMSLVGPRPPLLEEVRKYTARQKERLSVLPGLTCLWQISGRSNISFYEWVELDIYYIQYRSFSFDLKILIRTIPIVIMGKGAY